MNTNYNTYESIIEKLKLISLSESDLNTITIDANILIEGIMNYEAV